MRNTLYGERPVANRLKEANGHLNVTERLTSVNTGRPTGGDTEGYGTPIVGSVEQAQTKGQSPKGDES